jgi:hypothetical protein
MTTVLKITGFLDFVHRPVFWKLGNTKFRKLDLFPYEVRAETPTLLGPLERPNFNQWTKGPNMAVP